jgi:hypothetical protein
MQEDNRVILCKGTGSGFQPAMVRAHSRACMVSGMSMPFEFPPNVPIENSPLRCALITSKATRELDVGEDVKIEFDDGLKSLGGGAVAKAVRQGVAPGGVFGLQGEQFGDCIAPSLWSGAAIHRSAIADAR